MTSLPLSRVIPIAVLSVLSLCGCNPQTTESSSELFAEAGQLCTRDGKFRESIWKYKRVLATDPISYQGLLGVGIDLALLGDYKGALPYISRAIELKPFSLKAYCWKALCLYKTGNFSEALKDCQVAELGGHSTLLLCLVRARCLKTLNSPGSALKSYQKVIPLAREAWSDEFPEFSDLEDRFLMLSNDRFETLDHVYYEKALCEKSLHLDKGAVRDLDTANQLKRERCKKSLSYKLPSY